MDNVQPAMLNDYTEGKDWSAKGVTVKPDTGTQCTYSRRFTKTVGLCIYKLY